MLLELIQVELQHDKAHQVFLDSWFSLHQRTRYLKRSCSCTCCFSVQGVSVLRMMKSGDLLVGSGSGTFALCSRTNFKTLK